MLYGGSRSGKSFDHVRRIFVRASKCRSRHLIARLRFNHVKTSIWHETIPKVLDLCFPDLCAIPNKTDYFYRLPNGSEIWVAGLDDKDRTEKILGKEYSTVFFNECSQIPMASRNMVLTRLAERNELRKVAYYDQNPPSKKHWTYWLWEKHWDPVSEKTVNSDEYVSFLMNPQDNLVNIDPEYIEMIEALPEKERMRFLLGEYTDSEDGLVYYAFNESNIASVNSVPGHPIWIGIDFNVNPMTAVVCQIIGERLYVFDEIFDRNSNTQKVCNLIKAKYGTGHNIVPDSTGIKNTTNSNRSDHAILRENGFKVVSGSNPFRIDRYAAVNTQLERGNIVIGDKCKYTRSDLETLSYKEGTNKPYLATPDLGHISDALGYLVYKTINPFKSKMKPIQFY